MTDDAETDADTGAENDPAANGETTADVDAGADAAGNPADPAPAGDEAADRSGSTATGLAARVADADETLGEEVADLEARVDELEAETEELRSKLKRKQADFQNYKKRTQRKQDQLKERAAEDLVERLVPVRDNLLRALDQEEGADVRPGVESTLAELDRVLAEENVAAIEPEPGDEVDPHRHEVMLRVDADQAAGTVVDLYQPGYEMGDRVLRAAQVTVSTGEGGGEGENESD